ncbi:E3 ubiquitin-protein ligase TRIM39-like isoform X2 [Salvelinus sp. IW2-2015]|uniref:E3 ubiquitin-protein ligase TRIM39-like isoform X2 n=1 Tax=Salvelinus sp. IW2-2015 TaxID=2691554 RepID=UPI000CDFBF6E|nr:E3 ubiquitin-protein ligase TRIM39-like isoform X2 [Salvelinus alpinus]
MTLDLVTVSSLVNLSSDGKQVGDKTDRDVYVARESVNRKQSVTVRPDQGYWAVCRGKGGNLNACAGPSIPHHLRDKPKKVGVFVDYEEGLVSFYNVDDKAHIYSYSWCVFTETLYPYFSPSPWRRKEHSPVGYLFGGKGLYSCEV